MTSAQRLNPSGPVWAGYFEGEEAYASAGTGGERLQGRFDAINHLLHFSESKTVEH